MQLKFTKAQLAAFDTMAAAAWPDLNETERSTKLNAVAVEALRTVLERAVTVQVNEEENQRRQAAQAKIEAASQALQQ